jgi:hypothetical protein
MSNERRDEGNTRLRTRYCLLEPKQEGKVAVDALLLELAGGLDALSRASDLYESESRASTSLETRPGTILRIPAPKLTSYKWRVT